ncbi:MAG TPA: RpiB/LacA/LacB family sugar-phosphate isomerase [Solirubrobacteraceae bacterium]|jgi:ribose 5-phosphate isomerase B|nr:RpiB/LacA/LacB family sugar-phosphate isomerase [Solirubrobacteraceae bacterium]
MRIACGFDHAGVPLLERALQALRDAGHEPIDYGMTDDYPDIALTIARAVLEGEVERGVLICGSGAGVAVAACKVPGIRAAVAHDTYTAAQCVEHDDCNILCLGARVVGPELAASLLVAFAGASFSGAERHVRRLAKILAMERDGLDADLSAVTG